jgi:hypothetical protein
LHGALNEPSIANSFNFAPSFEVGGDAPSFEVGGDALSFEIGGDVVDYIYLFFIFTKKTP